MTVQVLLQEVEKATESSHRPAVIPKHLIQFMHQPPPDHNKTEPGRLTLLDLGLGGGKDKRSMFAVLEAPRFVISTVILLQLLAREHLLFISKKPGPTPDRREAHVPLGNGTDGGPAGDGVAEASGDEDGDEEGRDRWIAAANKQRRVLNDSLATLKTVADGAARAHLLRSSQTRRLEGDA